MILAFRFHPHSQRALTNGGSPVPERHRPGRRVGGIWWAWRPTCICQGPAKGVPSNFVCCSWHHQRRLQCDARIEAADMMGATDENLVMEALRLNEKPLLCAVCVRTGWRRLKMLSRFIRNSPK